jgi:hypothetical protein
MENEHIALLQAANSEAARIELGRFATDMQCERLRPFVVAALSSPNASEVPATNQSAQNQKKTDEAPTSSGVPETAHQEAALAPPATQHIDTPPKERLSNTPQLIKEAQNLLRQAGCLRSAPNGEIDARTKGALRDYGRNRKLDIKLDEIPESLIADLKAHPGRICPLECERGEIARGDVCVAAHPKQDHRETKEDRREDRRENRRETRAHERSEPIASNPRPRVTPNAAPTQRGWVGGVGF